MKFKMDAFIRCVLCTASATALTVSTLRAQIVADGATNTLSNVTNTITGDVTVGTNGSFTLLVLSDNALLTNSLNGVISRNATASSNEVRLISSTARWLMNGVLYVGSNGANATLVVSNGAFVSNGAAIIGNLAASSNNLALVTGGGSLWTNRNSLDIGGLGRGNQLIVSNGGWVVSRTARLGVDASGTNNLVLVTGSGSVWSNALNLSVGNIGPGNRLVIEAGGLVNDDTGLVGDFNSASNNEVLVSGPGSLWINRSSLTIGGQMPRNRLVVSNGAAVWSGNATIGSFGSLGNNNSVLLTDVGTLWSNQNDLVVGNTSFGNQLVVSNGATLITSNLFVGFQSLATNNRVVVDGGTLRVTNVAGNGTLDVRRGTNVLNAGLVDVDSLLVTNAAGKFEVNGGTLSVGNSKISNGQLFRVGNGVSPATLNLAGNGTHTFTDGLSVLNHGVLAGNGSVVFFGPLTVEAGGSLSPGASIGKIVLNQAPSLQGSVSMEISKNESVLTNDQVQVQVPDMLTYGGALTVTKIGSTALTGGDRFQLFSATSYGGSFTTLTLPSLNPGLSWTLKLNVDGSIEVTGISVQTLPASAIGSRTASLNGTVNPGGLPANAWFEYGFTTNYGNVTTSQAVGNGSAITNFSQVVTGLVAGATYHFRAVASNALAVLFGDDQDFTWFPNVLYTWPGTGNSQQWFRNFGAGSTSATLTNILPGELTIIETSVAAGGSQAFSDDLNRVRETPAQAVGGLDLTGRDYLEVELGHNGAGAINVQFFVQAATNFAYVALGFDLAVTPGVHTYQLPLSVLTPAQLVYIRTIGFNARDHAALGNVVWTLREIRAVGTPLATRDLVTFDNGTAEGGLQGAIVNFDTTGVLGNDGGQNQTGLSHNSAGSGSLQWTDLGGKNGGAISWGNGTAWLGNTLNNRTTDLGNFDTMIVRMSATGASGSIGVQSFFFVNNFASFQFAGANFLPIDGQFHDLSYSLAGLTNMNVVDQTGINLFGHPTDAVINVDLVRFEIAPLRITSIERLGPDIILKFRTSLGQKYSMERSSDLSTSNWTSFGSTVFGDGQEATVIDPGTALATDTRYYRVNQLP
jgi:T5SS/PEP-CTERM-associated repeat protein